MRKGERGVVRGIPLALWRGAAPIDLKRLSPMGWILKSLSFRSGTSPDVCCFSLGLNLRYF